jgi:hypothetical protein
VSEPQKRSFLASLFRRDKDAEETDDNAAVRETASVARNANAKSEASKSDGNKPEPSKLMPARIQLASAAEPVVSAPPVPLPPRRPIYQVAETQTPLPLPAPRQPAPVQVASLSANQIVDMRGLWDSLDTTPTAGTNALNVSSARRLLARAPAPADSPFPAQAPRQDRIPPDAAMAYAADNDAQRASVRVAAAMAPQKGQATVTNKPSTVAKSRAKPANERLDDPWLRGLVLAASLQNSMVVTQVGDPDFTALTQFMTKPGSSVLMTFSVDPYVGMNAEQFTGSSVVFPTTITFGSRHTASLN